MEFLTLIIEETQKLGDEWRKCLKRYGMEDKRTINAYNQYIGADKLRTQCMELHEAMQEVV